MRISPNWYYNWTLFVIYNPRCAVNAGVVFTVFLSSPLKNSVYAKHLSLRFNFIDFSKLKNSVLKGGMELNFQVLISYELN